MYTYEKNMHTGIAHLKEVVSGLSLFHISELTPLGACMKEGLCIGRPVFMSQHQDRLWEWADLYDKEIPLDVAGRQNYVC